MPYNYENRQPHEQLDRTGQLFTIKSLEATPEDFFELPLEFLLAAEPPQPSSLPPSPTDGLVPDLDLLPDLGSMQSIGSVPQNLAPDWPDHIVNLPLKDFQEFVRQNGICGRNLAELKKQRRRVKGRQYASDARKRRTRKTKTLAQQLEAAEATNASLVSQLQLLEQRCSALQDFLHRNNLAIPE